MVFLHGIIGNRTNWRDQLPSFAQSFHAVAWDARGYGLSDDYEGLPTYDDYCRDLIRVLDHLKTEKAHLVGLSMGGVIAQDFYGRYPQRVASMVLADTRPGWEPAFDVAMREEFFRLRLKPLQGGKSVAEIAPAEVRSLMGSRAGEDIFARLVESMEALHKESYMKSIEARGNWRPVSVTVPTLVVVGSEDRLTPPSMALAIAAAISKAQVAEIPGFD